MKKLFLFTCLSALALTFNSCSDDDSSSNNNGSQQGGTVSFKIGGVQKTFNTVTVHEIPNEEENYTWCEVTASNNGSSTEMIYFELEKGDTGADKFGTFSYLINSDNYGIDWDNFSSNTTVNNDSKLKGTFSGKVIKWDNATQTSIEKQITEGTFDINL